MTVERKRVGRRVLEDLVRARRKWRRGGGLSRVMVTMIAENW